MRIEFFIIIVVAIICIHIYTEGKWLDRFIQYKKYYQIAGVVLFGFAIYWVFKTNPKQAHNLISSTNDYLKVLPIDQTATSIISPIIDFTSKWTSTDNEFVSSTTSNNKRMMSSGGGTSKRSVSESKKKYVAAEQNWKCAECGDTLKASFEVDHKVRLEVGGDNSIGNLRALCRNCHGQKTTIENL